MAPPQLLPFHVLLNPSSGSKQARAFYERTIQPLLTNLEASYTLWETQAEGDGARVGRQIASLEQARDEQPAGQTPSSGVKVVVLGGDGTAYELINGFFSASASFASTGLAATSSTSSDTIPISPAQSGSSQRKLQLEIVPLPLGTANALYSHFHSARPTPSSAQSSEDEKEGETFRTAWWTEYLAPSTTDEDITKLQALGSLLSGCMLNFDDGDWGKGWAYRQANLSLTQATFLPDPSVSFPSTPVPTLSHIVLSLALHASLLHLSEELRATHPGIERFKLAAERVLHVRHQGRLTLPANTTLRYDPRSKSFHPLPAGSTGTLDGPFAYVTSIVTVDRLEPTFHIAPTLAIPGYGRSIELLVLRPDRSRAVKEGGEEAWVATVKEVLGGAYQGGKHVDLVLSDPDATDDGGPGVMEVYRTPSFTFTPSSAVEATPSDTDDGLAGLNELVCADGAVYRIPAGGSVEVKFLDQEQAEVFVWVGAS